MKAVKYLALIIFGSLSLVVLTLFVTRPAVPDSSPATYPSAPKSPIEEGRNSWELYAQAEVAYLNGKEPSALLEGESEPVEVINYNPALELLREARLRPNFRCAPDETFTSTELLEYCFAVAEIELDRGKLNYALDGLTALSRLTMHSSHRFSGSLGLGDAESTLKTLRSKILGLSIDHRERLLADLNRLVDEQSTFVEFLQAQRDHTIRRVWTQPSSNSPSRISQLMHQRRVDSRSKTSDYTRIKFDRWIHLVKQGDLAATKREWELYWRPILPVSAFENVLFIGHYFLFPGRVSANMANRYTIQPTTVADPLTDLLVSYNQRRLLWESMRLELAISIFHDRYQQPPKYLKMLVSDGLLSHLPRDPYFRKGESSRVTLQYDGEKCWSVGWDGIDQGGEKVLTSYTSIASQGDLIVWP